MHNGEERASSLRGVFLAAADRIIEKYGADGLSVRKIAAAAGYSYAAIYSYFENIGVLKAWLVKDYLEESADYVEKQYTKGHETYCDLKKILFSYCDFFYKNPEKFSIIFVSGNIDNNQLSLPPELIDFFSRPPRVSRMHFNVIYSILSQKGYKKKDIEVYSDICSSYLHGKLSYYLYREKNKKLEEFMDDIYTGYSLILREGTSI
ncbi:MAG: TetR family transcriptional regulator [Deltaproteobacteria bacterium]|nr:TetR family transcriptional regulator [Deltaproteobacteria bacterium]